MATVTESIALGTLLRWVLKDASGYHLSVPTSDEAREAAALLVEKQGKTGACCYGAEQVRRLWPAEVPHA